MAKSLLESLDNINRILDLKCTDAGGDIHFNPEKSGPFHEEAGYVADRLGITEFQAILLAVIIQASAKVCNFRKVGMDLGMSYLRILSYAKDFYALRDLGLIRISRENDIKVPPEALEALMKDKPFEKPKLEGLSPKAILRRIGRMMHLLSREQTTPDQALEEIDLIISSNPESSYGKACLGHLSRPKISDDERFLFYVLSHLFVNRGFTKFDADDLEDYYSSDENTLETLRDRFEDGSLELLTQGLLEPTHQDGMVSSRGSYSFKEDIIKEFFSEVRTPEACIKIVDLKDNAGITEKQLFYNTKEGEQVARLSSLLMPENLRPVFETMEAKGLRTGFTCLFYGSPGTGKTETVYQLARQTGRKILEADVAQLRNCYVGETEKNVRALFASYKIANAENKLSPILLFNEADAILGTRMEGAARAIDRMENSVQNILLQEMESFSGILIATTNLTANLDPAFERRFLYKIRFDKPSLEPRANIWQTNFPFLTQEESLCLASTFDFSGGQIENIVRKQNVDSILSGTAPTYDTLYAYCKEEMIDKTRANKIGF